MTARLQLRLADDSEREIPLEAVRADDVSAATPWRTFRSHRAQRHYSGWYWSSTTGALVIYESRLELARLLLADADRDVVAIAAQPFLLIEGTDSRARRHVPDFFLQRLDGSCTVVNVKPADKVDDPKVAATLAWAGKAITAKGWAAEVWTGCDPLLLANVRFLAGYRRSWLLDPVQLDAAEAAILEGDTIGHLEARLWGSGVAEPRPLILHLLGRGASALSSPRHWTPIPRSRPPREHRDPRCRRQGRLRRRGMERRRCRRHQGHDRDGGRRLAFGRHHPPAVPAEPPAR